MSEQWTDSHENYRVRSLGEGAFQAEMLYQCKDGPLWIPLKQDGYWADPEAYSTGVVTVQYPLSRVAAKRAMFNAMEINKVHLGDHP